MKMCPSSFLHKHQKGVLPKGKGKLYTYERDIICLPRHFMTNNDNYIEIPRKKEAG